MSDNKLDKAICAISCQLPHCNGVVAADCETVKNFYGAIKAAGYVLIDDAAIELVAKAIYEYEGRNNPTGNTWEKTTLKWKYRDKAKAIANKLRGE